MTRSDQSNLLADLAKAKALFQQRTIVDLLREGADRSKPDQEVAQKEEG